MATITPIPPEKRFQDLTGQRFGRLVVLGWAGHSKPNAAWVCRCDCGGEKLALSHNLKSLRTRSCGCLNLENLSNSGSADFCARDTKMHPEHKVWGQMIRRCHNPTERRFADYGGRGISVCDRWRYGENGTHGFMCFMTDMGSRPSPKHTIDRVNNNLGYSPDNCEWRTRTEQVRNRRNTIMIVYQDREMSLAEACEIAGVPLRVASSRLRNGMAADLVLSQPIKKQRGHTPNRTVVYCGETMLLAAACKLAGISLGAVQMRIHRGMSAELALSQPPRLRSTKEYRSKIGPIYGRVSKHRHE
jgi:hypothetical protein